MEVEYRDKLLRIGTSLDEALDRFLENEEMYLSFLHKFTKDENFEKLRESLESGDVKQAFHCAHTMKGVAANLGLDSLLVPLNPLVESLRANRLEGTTEQFVEVEKKYKEVCEVINSF